MQTENYIRLVLELTNKWWNSRHTEVSSENNCENNMEVSDEHIKCMNCEKILRPPLQMCVGKHLVCPYCSQHHDSSSGTIDNIESCAEEVFPVPVINKLFQNSVDVCQYDCGHRDNLLSLDSHERDCYRNDKLVKCAVPGCSWFKVLSKLVEHVDENHSGQILDLSEGTTNLYIGPNNPVVLLTQYKKNVEDNLLYWVRFHQEKTDSYVMMLHIGRSKPVDKENQQFLQFAVSSVSNPKLNIKDKIQIYCEPNQDIRDNAFVIKNGTCVNVLEGDTYLVEVVKSFLDDIPDSLLKDLECYVCLEIMSSPIRMCASGHSMCGGCANRVACCPKCKMILLSTRNYDLEHLAHRIAEKKDRKRKRAYCKYLKDGCKFIDTPNEVTIHEDECDFQEISCSVCPWIGTNSGIEQHCRENHNVVANLSKCVFDALWSCCLIKHHNHKFLLTRISSDLFHYFSVRHLSSANETEFHFHLTLSHPRVSKSVYFSGRCFVSALFDPVDYDGLFSTRRALKIPFSYYSGELIDENQRIQLDIKIDRGTNVESNAARNIAVPFPSSSMRSARILLNPLTLPLPNTSSM